MSNKSFITRSTTGLSVAQEEDVTELQNQINTIDTSLIVIEDKLNDLDISLGLLNNVDNSINKLDISVNFLDLSGVEFSLGISKLDISVNKLETSANKYELYETSLNFLEASGVEFSLGISKLDVSVNKLETSANKYELFETSLNFLEASGVEFSLGISKLDVSVNKLETSANKYELFETSLNFLEASGVEFSLGISKLDISVNKLETSANKYELFETSLNFLEASGVQFSLGITANTAEIAVIENSCNVYEISINALETAGGGSLWTESGASIYRQNGLVGIGGDIINTSPNLQLDVSGIFRVAQMETDADDNTQNNKAGFVADGRTGQIYCYNNDNVPSSSSSNPGVGFGVDALTLRQLNRFEDQPKLYTEIYAKQLHRTIKGGSYSQTKQDRSAVWGIGVRNETQQYAGSQYESSILALAYGGGSVTVNNSSGTWNNNGYRFRVHGNMAASGYATISDDRIKYHETDITGALETLNKLKVQKYQKITESVNQTGKWIPSNEEWDSVKNSVDSSGHRLFEYDEQIGFIAQEVRKINDLSFCVSGKEVDETGDETPLLVNYEDIFSLSIQGIQELNEKVNTLENEIKILKGE